MADLEVRVYGRGSPPLPLEIGPGQTLQAAPATETIHAVANTASAAFEEGLAASYPGDIGIEADPDVLFAEMFEEADMTTLGNNWSSYSLEPSTFSPEVPTGSPGSQSLALTQRVTPAPAVFGSLFKNFGGQGTSAIYARCYFRYGPGGASRPDHSGIWMGGNAPEMLWAYVPPGTRPPQTDEADNWFSGAAELGDKDTGRIEHYNYWPGMHDDHGDGTGAYWGNFLLMDPDITINANEWFCLEVMIKPNNPATAYNGEHAIWLNGVKISHLGLGFPNGSWFGNRFTQDPGGPTPFEGFNWIVPITGDTFDINWVWLQCYNGSQNSTILVDHFVVARRYIGPLTPSVLTGVYVSTTGNDATGDGSVTSPWRTIAFGLGQLSAGDTLSIRGGLYTEQFLEVDFGATGTSGSRIIVQAYPGETVTIRSAAGAGNVCRFQDTSIQYVTLKDLIFDGTTENGGGDGQNDAVMSCHSAHMRFERCIFQNGRGHGVLLGGDDHYFLDCQWIRNGTGPYDASNGLYAGYVTNCTFKGGVAYNNEGYGIRVYQSGTAPPNPANNNVVDGVLSWQNGYQAGLDGGSLSSSGGGGFAVGDNNLTVMNCIAYDNFWGLQDANDSGTAVNIKVYNCTFYANVNGVSWQNTLGGGGLEFKNNISVGNFANNLYISAPTVAQATNVTSGSVNFVDVATRDLRLLASATNCLNVGTDLSATVTEDYYGTARPVGAGVDIGAHERTAGDP